MSSLVKKMLYTAWGVAGLAAILSILDLVMGMPFGGSKTLDICLLISAAIVGYMGYSVRSDQSA